MEGYIGMPYEDLTELGEDYGWEMDQLFVRLSGDRWYAVELTNWVVSGWERV